MFQAPINNVVVKFDKKYIKNITGMINMAHVHNANINPADYVNTICEVISIPQKITTDIREYTGFSTQDIYEGDTAIVRYDVIADFIHRQGEELPTMRNELWYKGQTYFVADIIKVFGVIRGGDIYMVNGYCMVEDIEPESQLILAQRLKGVSKVRSATLTAIGNPLTHQRKIDALPGDRVYFPKNQIQIYQANGKPYGIVHQSKILGRSVADYSVLHKLN